LGTILTRPDLHQTIEGLKASGKRIVSTNGCFDILHVGHVRFLKAARAFGDVLIVGVNTDESVRKLKGHSRPINNEDDRAEILINLIGVDYVCLFGEDTPVEFLKIVQPHVHAKGGDYNKSDLAETPIVESFGGKMEIIDLVPGKSTTSIVDRLNADQIEADRINSEKSK
jgi:D-glycero-beta-D-manno-heptose 1-phosphate adenylyltransferase